MWKASRNNFPRSERCNLAAVYYYTDINYCKMQLGRIEVKRKLYFSRFTSILFRKWKVYSNNLCKRIWESLILALEAGSGIKQQDARIKMNRTAKPTAVSCSLFTSLFFFPGQKMEFPV